jgi:hypothetical protein
MVVSDAENEDGRNLCNCKNNMIEEIRRYVVIVIVDLGTLGNYPPIGKLNRWKF